MRRYWNHLGVCRCFRRRHLDACQRCFFVLRAVPRSAARTSKTQKRGTSAKFLSRCASPWPFVSGGVATLMTEPLSVRSVSQTWMPSVTSIPPSRQRSTKYEEIVKTFLPFTLCVPSSFRLALDVCRLRSCRCHTVVCHVFIKRSYAKLSGDSLRTTHQRLSMSHSRLGSRN